MHDEYVAAINENAYRDHVQAMHDAAKCTAKKSISKLPDKVKEFYEPDEEGVYNIAVSGDGTWRRLFFIFWCGYCFVHYHWKLYQRIAVSAN